MIRALPTLITRTIHISITIAVIQDLFLIHLHRFILHLDVKTVAIFVGLFHGFLSLVTACWWLNLFLIVLSLLQLAV
jgi:hypothetical protein